MGNTAGVASDKSCKKSASKCSNAKAVEAENKQLPAPKTSKSKKNMSNLLSDRDRASQWANGDSGSASIVSGMDRLKSANFNKGLAFTLEERQTLNIHGLLPPRVKTQEQQMEHCIASLDRLEDNLDKYIYLMGLLDRNEKLFFSLVDANVSKLMPLVYTPVVGLACQKFGLVFHRPRGLFITIHDRGHVYEILRNWPEQDVRAICVTDGERILGLGDLGANGMGIPIGKLALYTALAGIKPHQCLPVTLDVGTNTDAILNDPLYIGLNERRCRGPEYDDLIEEFMQAAVRRYGQSCLIQFEDFGNLNAFRLLEKYRRDYTTFNDDIQGTASVAVAGLLASLKVTGHKLCEETLVFQGAGEASLGIAELCMMAMVKEGCSEEHARNKIWMVDSKGLIVKNRPEGGVTGNKVLFARDHPPIADLAEVVRTIKPTILIGASTIGGAFTPEILQQMAKNTERPVIFALSNPTHKAECTAEAAYTHTDGKAIFASGSPFPTFNYNGKTFMPGQGNNSYIFPGIGLACVTVGLRCIPDEVFLRSAETLCNMVKESDLEVGRMYPPLEDIKNCSLTIAVSLAEYAYENGLAILSPRPADLQSFIKAQMYDPKYVSALPTVYPYPTS